jgi:hypothetical protein
MKAFFRFVLVALVLLLVAMASALLAMRFAIHGSEVTVPTVVGLTPSEAERAVAGSGSRDESAAGLAGAGRAESGTAACGDSGCTGRKWPRG